MKDDMLQILINDHNFLKGQIANKDIEMADLKTQLRITKVTLTKTEEALNDEIKQRQVDLDEVNKEDEKIQQRFDDFQLKNETLKNQLQEAKTKYDALKKELDELKAKIKSQDAKNDVTAYTNQIQELSKANKGLSTELKKLEFARQRDWQTYQHKVYFMNAGYTIPIQQMPQGPVQAPVYQYCVDKVQILIPATHGVVSGQPAGQHNPVYDPRIAQRPHVHKPEDLVQDEKIVQEPPAPLHNAIMQVISQNAGEKEQPLRYRSDPSLFCAEPNSDSMTCNLTAQPTQKGVKRAAFRELPNMGCQAKISRVVETIVSD